MVTLFIKVVITVDGSVTKQETYTSTTGRISGAIPEGKTGKVCGFYQYKNSDDAKAKSNEKVCRKSQQLAAVSKDSLSSLYQSASALNNAEYTPESWLALDSARQAAKIVMDNTSATQAEVDQALNNLQNAVNGLVKNYTGSTNTTCRQSR